MARRKKKQNISKNFLNVIIFLILLFIIFFLIQKFIIPLWKDQQFTETIPEDREEPSIEEVEPEAFEKVEIPLYFSDEDARHLIPEYREMEKRSDLVKNTIVELIKGPSNQNLYPTIPNTTKVNALYVQEGIAYIDLSSEVVRDHPGGSTGELLTIYSLVLTLTSFPGIDKVQILIDGNSGETLVGHVDISVPLERDEEWLSN
ncbi:MAG: GerMN domain-containing protein [Candidatus Atribacteria bacterium]|nr:GerMN domain-containing protein [Candidatus Atribacteria bacterium]